MAQAEAEAEAEASDAVDVGGSQPKKRAFGELSFRGFDLDQLLDVITDELPKALKRFRRYCILKEDNGFCKKQDASPREKPEPVRTRLQNMIIVPEMIPSIIGVYNGKTFNQLEIKPKMIGHYLAEFFITYKPPKHGRPGIDATHSSRFIPVK